MPERAVGERREIGERPSVGGVPDPELAEKARRRQFTAAYELKVVLEAERRSRPGEIGALLRREGLYSSLLTQWRQARDSGALHALEPRKRGPAGPSAEQLASAQLRRERDQAVFDLQTARRVIEVQGNVCALLDELLAKLVGAGVTRSIAMNWRDFYRAEIRRNPNNPSAAGRADLMDAAARLLR